MWKGGSECYPAAVPSQRLETFPSVSHQRVPLQNGWAPLSFRICRVRWQRFGGSQLHKINFTYSFGTGKELIAHGLIILI